MIPKNNLASSIFELINSKEKSYLSYSIKNKSKAQESHSFFDDVDIYTHTKIVKNNALPNIIIANDAEIYHLFNALNALKDMNLITKTPLIIPDIRISKEYANSHEALHFDSIKSFYDEFRILIAKLYEWYQNIDNYILLSPTFSLLNYMPNKHHLQSFNLAINEKILMRDLVTMLIECGYENVDIVEMRGEFCVHGDILDIFCASYDFPIRISFFDNEIESIKFFDLVTQRSHKDDIGNVEIAPALFTLQESDIKILQEKINHTQVLDFDKNISSIGFWFLKDIGGINLFKDFFCVFTPSALIEYEENLDRFDEDFIFKHITLLKKPSAFSDFDLINKFNLKAFLDINANAKIHIIVPNKAFLDSFDIDFSVFDVIISPYFLCIKSKDEIFLSLQKSKYKQHTMPKIRLDSYKLGEYIVHNDYGVGIFDGLQKVTILGNAKDVISIIYDNDDRLLLPVENMDLIARYGLLDSSVKLDKLGQKSWGKLRDKVKDKLFEIAGEIINIQAKREIFEGMILNLENDMQKSAYAKFENARGFDLTNSQKRALQECFADLNSGKVMDRLLSGDVGFGKTEIAMSLAFVALLNNKISVIVSPTTILCAQHFESFKERFKKLDLDSKIFRLDRFSSQKQKNQIIDLVKNNEAIIIIATHSALNLDIKNLALIVIDEEHKFGVKQKEIVKNKSLNTHILYMSATPIPRTLNMAYSKIKSISILDDAPSFKKDSKTFVKIKSDALIKDAILRELRRGGQVFYIFNNISKINLVDKYLKALIPNLRILILHSKIDKIEGQQYLEDSIIDFINRKYDVLLSTTIVESGLHFPNANTIIVEDAINFGLADLHQLRGRVGRGSHIGFCYFLIDDEDISEVASKRLNALEKSSYIGSGAHLAYNDLEIRGGGNLLGKAQSGHIKHIGFGMYVKMLEDALLSLSKESNDNHSNHVDLKLNVSAFLNENLIQSSDLRLDLYHRLSRVKTLNEVENIRDEIKQRFGALDSYSNNFLDLICIKILAIEKNITQISNFENNISITKKIIESNGEFATLQKNEVKKYIQSNGNVLATIKEFLQKENAF